MATLILSAAGAAAGASFGGSVLGLSAAVLGRAAGAVAGQALDQRLMGAGSEPVETGRVDRFRLTGAGEGTAVARVYGRIRVPGEEQIDPSTAVSAASSNWQTDLKRAPAGDGPTLRSADE